MGRNKATVDVEVASTSSNKGEVTDRESPSLYVVPRDRVYEILIVSYLHTASNLLMAIAETNISVHSSATSLEFSKGYGMDPRSVFGAFLQFRYRNVVLPRSREKRITV